MIKLNTKQNQIFHFKIFTKWSLVTSQRRKIGIVSPTAFHIEHFEGNLAPNHSKRSYSNPSTSFPPPSLPLILMYSMDFGTRNRNDYRNFVKNLFVFLWPKWNRKILCKFLENVKKKNVHQCPRKQHHLLASTNWTRVETFFP